MIDVNEILRFATKKDASDIHLISGMQPMLRVFEDLVPYDDCEELIPDDMNDIYDYFIRGNVHKDEEFKEKKRLDLTFEFEGIRFRVNISSSNDIPVFTLSIIKNELPTLEELGVPNIIKKKICEGQGLILITGRAKSGKTTTLNALINYINENQNKIVLTLESPVEFKHEPKKSIIVQKEVGDGQDVLTYEDGVKNSLKEDCDVLAIGEIRDRNTMDAAIEAVETGHLVIGIMNTRTCSETIDRIISFYDINEQQNIKYEIASLLKLVISQRILKNERLIMIPEVMVMDNIIARLIKKEKFNICEVENVMQSLANNGSVGLLDSIAKLFIEEKITLEQAKAQVEEKDIENLNRTIMQLKIKKGNSL